MAGIKKLTKKLAFPLFVAAAVFTNVNAMAQTEGDIVSIASDQANSIVTASGTTIDMRITLNGSFQKISDGGSSTGNPMIRMIVNGTVGWAELTSVSRYAIAGGTIDRTDVNFTYTVAPGDMASPLALYGFAGGTTVGGSFQFIWNGWQISVVGDDSTLADWRFDTNEMVAGDVYDPDFSAANVVLRTLAFDDSNSPVTVAATETVSWRVTTVNPIESTVVDFYVWPEDSSVAQVGSTPGQALLVSMPTGATEVDFPVRGLAVGTTDIYLQRTADYLNNGTSGVTNFITRSITVSAPPEPTVRVIMSDNGSDNISMDESGILSTGNFRVELSEAYASAVTVQIDTSIAGTPQSSLTFASDPFTVVIPAGDTTSPDAKFNVPDGTQLSAATGVTLTPTIQDPTAAAHYTRVREATVYVNNVAPVITRPDNTDSFVITRGVSSGFEFTVEDVPVDRPDMITRWNFGDSTPEQVYTGHVGQAFHTYAATGNYTVSVQAEDKDGSLSSEILFAVSVEPPAPQPSVTITPSSYVYNETTANASGALEVTLSESFNEDVYIRLETDPAAQSNIILSSTNAFRISAGTTNRVTPFRFSVADGTSFSELTGITLRPVVTNAAAAAYYTDLKETVVFVENVDPVVVRPLASDLGSPADPTYGYDQVPLGQPFTFDYEISDVDPDLAGMSVEWTFGDGGSSTVIGADGSVAHTYSSLGDKIVSLQATDKDGGVSTLIEFKVTVVTPPPPPTVRIIRPAFELAETDTPYTGEISVQLTEAFTNVVAVHLSMNISGVLNLSETDLTFNVGETNKIVYLSPVDGTWTTRVPGVNVTPTVVGTAAAVAHYTTESAYVNIANVAPVINNPVASDTTSDTPAYTVPQGAPTSYYWSIADVAADLTTMSVTWDWGDGTTDAVTGGSGYISHTYSSLGDKIIRVDVIDKDGGAASVSFKISVLQSKTVQVTPFGPNGQGYFGAAGRGNGIVTSPEARTSVNKDNIYEFTYDPSVDAAFLKANPYEAGQFLRTYDSTGVETVADQPLLYDSFFYVWYAQEDQGLSTIALTPGTATASTQITLPQVASGTDGAAVSVETREVVAVFSREYRTKDNMGDINLDGIPDSDAQYYGLDLIDNESSVRDDLESRMDYNEDGDYLPPSTGYTGAAFLGGLTNVFAELGREFTAFKEIRGEDPGLNRPGLPNGIATEQDGPIDEPGAYSLEVKGGTSPLKYDTDGDGFPDGWEYYFWREAKLNNFTGEEYNPNDVAQGIPIISKIIEGAFNPIVPSTDESGSYGVAANRDLDKDGLLDLEELVIGTNPVHWDTDGDTMCDGWEVMRGLNPNDPRDGLDVSLNNPDGDYMAYTTVPLQRVTVIGNQITNSYITSGAAIGDSNGVFYTWYNYGTSNDPVALGKKVDLVDGEAVTALEDIDVALLHFQVRDEFGFDPRTAWTASIDTGRFGGTGAQGAAPNTRPFTSRDEYLLMKFMHELGYVGAIPAGADHWTPVSTNPRTPDTDANNSGADSVPDGWELYVATQQDSEDPTMLISPWNHEDYDDDLDPSATGRGDGLSVLREYAGIYSSAEYASANLYFGGTGTVTIVPSGQDQYWVNKFWPTNPWSLDTDKDGLSDSVEQAFIYGNPVDGGGLFTAGGGLNPNSKDTDRDALTDSWEVQFYGTPVATDGSTSLPPSLPGQPQTPVSMTISNGMDGTVADSNEDWDHDGLLNYQEYWVQAVRSFRYDLSTNEVPMDAASYDVGYFFTEITNEWDIARFPWGTSNPPSRLLLPAIGSVYVGFNTTTPTTHCNSPIYTSSDPRNEDSDDDAMDDYYEMYHGLNPILGMGANGDIISDVYSPLGMSFMSNPFYTAMDMSQVPMNFVTYPWLAGLPEADCDSDGLINFEEMLLANTAAAPNYNTDPTALWMTDYHNPNSLASRFYYSGGMFFWPGTAENRMTMKMGLIAMFDHEINEGYDTDNDGLSDKAELVHSRNSTSDPRNQDDPLRRQAMYFSGTNSVARTITSHMFDEWTFRSFTVEMWACPEVVNADQVMLERSVSLIPSDQSDPAEYRPRRTFQIGIVADGRVYAKFDSSGSESHDSHTATAIVYGPILQAGEWVHVTARMDGALGKFDIMINGELYATIDTMLIPATGIVTIDNPVGGGVSTIYYYTGAIVAGAADNTPSAPVLVHEWDGFDKFYQGYIDEVRIWDGARPMSDINADLYKRYTRADIENNREEIRFDEAMGSTRIIGDDNPLGPELLYHYTFDNIFSAEDASSIALEPRGFMDAAVTTNRPAAALNSAIMFSESPVVSTVYTNYEYLSLIENGVDHLPSFGGIRTIDSIIQVLMSDDVPDSVFWSETMAGTTPGKYVFPNDNNPYGITYDFDQNDPVNSGFVYFGDMLPLGDAFAKTAPTMWDKQGPSAPWSETGTDSDSDGLPDWWELAFYGNNDNGWDDFYLDGSGMTNGERYLRDIAAGATPNNPTGIGGLIQIADLDGDGMPDWWEDIFSLDKQSAVGVDGATGDYDRDGLPNLSEYLISEVYKFRYMNPRLFRTSADQTYSDYFQKEGSMTLGEMFTDHDFVEDYWEDVYDPYYVNSFVYDAHEDNDEDGWSNWAEARYASVYRDIDPDSIISLLPDMQSIAEYPIPVIKTKMRYDGSQSGGNLIINAYTTPSMDGIPDATYSFVYDSTGVSQQSRAVSLGAWKAKTFYSTLTPGSIAPGTLRISFTDQWNTETVETGYDNDGTIYMTIIDGRYLAIGKIDYKTGEISIDLSRYDGSYIQTDNWEDGVPFDSQDRGAYLLMDQSTVDITYSVNLNNTWPKTLYLGKADTGWIQEGLNYFFAYIDLDGNGTWNAGEPCGLPDNFATDIGWDGTELSIELTDYREGYLRFDMTTGMSSKDVLSGKGGDSSSGTDLASPVQRIRVHRTIGNISETVLDRTITGRTYLHEGDLFDNGELALDWNLAADGPSSVVVYSVYLGDEYNLFDNTLVSVFTNEYVYDSQNPKQEPAVSTEPINGSYVYSSRPVFRWTMPDLYPAFAIEIRKNSSSGPVVYNSGPVKAPSRDVITGEYIWEAPIHAGNKLPSGHIFSVNTVYAWRVTTLNSRYSMDIEGGSDGTGAGNDGWSEWKLFRLDVNRPIQSSGYGMIDATVKYFGPALGNLVDNVKVEAYTTRDFTGVADSQYTLSNSELLTLVDSSTTNINAVLRGLTPSDFAGSYYVMAYIDSNNNNQRDDWESWGYANYYGKNVLVDSDELDSDSIFRDLFGGMTAPYVAQPVDVAFGANIPSVKIIIEDADTDQDWFPDAWEYSQNPGADFLEPIGPSPSWPADMGNTEVNPTLTTGAWPVGTVALLVFGSTDSDGDGLDDATELILGTDVSTADPASTVENVNLGLAPEDSLELSVDGLGLADGLMQLTWNVDVDKTESTLSQGMLNLMSANPDGEVTYYVDFTPSLSNPAWTTVKTGTVQLEGTQTLINKISVDTATDPSGFFRVRLGN